MSNPNLPNQAGYNTYVGARYVPVFSSINNGQWTNTAEYEPLTIVMHNGNSYTSKTYVPVGIDINNTTYWAPTGNYNAQIEAYREEVQNYAAQVKNIIGHSYMPNVKYPPAGYTAAVGDYTTDDTKAFKALLNDFHAIYIPAGLYRITDTLAYDDVVIMGDQDTNVVCEVSDKTKAILKIGGRSLIMGGAYRFSEPTIQNGCEDGELIVLDCSGVTYPLQRNSLVSTVSFGYCGTGIETGNAFSVLFNSVTVENYINRGISQKNTNMQTTQNIYTNVYIGSGKNGNAKYGFVSDVFTSGLNIINMNIEHSMFTEYPFFVTNCNNLSIMGLHLEGIGVTHNYRGFVGLEAACTYIDGLTFCYTRNENIGSALISITNCLGMPGSDSHSNQGSVVIKNLSAVGIADPNQQLYPNYPSNKRGLNNLTDFAFIYSLNSMPLDCFVKVDSYTWSTYQSDSNQYEEFKCIENASNFYITKKGDIKEYGTTANRPTKRLCKYYSKYYDTNENAMKIWNGSTWV